MSYLIGSCDEKLGKEDVASEENVCMGMGKGECRGIEALRRQRTCEKAKHNSRRWRRRVGTLEEEEARRRRARPIRVGNSGEEWRNDEKDSEHREV